MLRLFHWNRLGFLRGSRGVLVRQALRYRSLIVPYLTCVLLAAGFTALAFFLLKDLVQLGRQVSEGKLLLLVAGTVVCWFLGEVLVYVSDQVGLRVEQRVTVDLVKQAFDNRVERGRTSFRAIDPNVAVHDLRNGLTTLGKSLRAGLGLLCRSVMLAFTLAAAFWIHAGLATMVVVSLAACGCLAARHDRRRREGAREARLGERAIHGRLCRVLESLPQIKLFQAQGDQLERTQETLQQQWHGEQRVLLADCRTRLELSVGAAVSALAVLGVGTILLRGSHATAAQLTAMLAMQQSLFNGLRQLLAMRATVRADADWHDKLLCVPPGEIAPTTAGKQVSRPINLIECEQAACTIGETALLQEIDCRLQRGRMYALVGPSRSGKSMLLKLLSGELPLRTGRVRVNGIDQADLDRADLGRRTTLVCWPPLCISATLADNLRLARPNATEPELLVALERAALTTDLARWQAVGGLQALLGRHSVQLSVGQLQRLSLARAFLQCPEVLLVDGFLSGLDPAAEEKLLVSLRSHARENLVVLVASNARCLRYCDEVLVMDDGRLVEQTTPDKVLEDPSLAAVLASAGQRGEA